MGRTRAVIYARYSSDNQREASIEDQLRVCRARVEREGWKLIETYTDHAMSGGTMLRPGYQNLLAAMQAGSCDVVVAESLDRFSRDLEHIAAFFKQSAFRDVRIHTLAEGDISELHVGLKGVMGALYLKDLADKTRRGLEGRIHAGRCTGSAPYGYKVVLKMREDGERDRGLREIDPEAASVVRRIFSEYAAGMSPRRIAQGLNADGIRGPGGGIWYDASVRGRETRRDGILRNALYSGRIVWRRRLNMKDPTTGARLRRNASPDSFVTVEVPHLTIIDEALWEKVQARLKAEAADPVPDAGIGQHAFWTRRRAKHLLSGKVTCGACGRPFHPTGKDYLGCNGAKNGACSNRRTVKRATLEGHVMDILGRQLMQPDLLAEFVQSFKAEWQRLDGEVKAQAASLHRERSGLDRKIANLVNLISDGEDSPAILAKLRELESKRRAMGEADPRPSVSTHRVEDGDEMADCYAARLMELTRSLTLGDDPEALEIARSLIDQVIVRPATDHDPGGLEVIGSLLDLLKAAGLDDAPAQEDGKAPDPVLALFVRSVKEGPGAEPLAFLLPPR